MKIWCLETGCHTRLNMLKSSNNPCERIRDSLALGTNVTPASNTGCSTCKAAHLKKVCAGVQRCKLLTKLGHPPALIVAEPHHQLTLLLFGQICTGYRLLLASFLGKEKIESKLWNSVACRRGTRCAKRLIETSSIVKCTPLDGHGPGKKPVLTVTKSPKKKIWTNRWQWWISELPWITWIPSLLLYLRAFCQWPGHYKDADKAS